MRVRLSHLEWAYKITTLYGKLLSNDDISKKEDEEEVKAKK